jgi:1,4-dihydroxy-2-naphthoate octaprenyltransferase
VLIGSRASRVLFGVLMLVPYAVLAFLTFVYPTASLVFLTLLVSGPAILITATAKTARELVLALTLTGLTALTYGLGLAAVLAF